MPENAPENAPENSSGPIVILGVFVADTAYRAPRQPRLGETILGENFTLGPGGKGSNQAVAAARAGGQVHKITRHGVDAFADIALATWEAAGVVPEIERSPESYTGAAYIFLESGTGQNAIIVAPGAAGLISEADIDRKAALIGGASVFLTQLEQPIPAAIRALRIARAAGASRRGPTCGRRPGVRSPTRRPAAKGAGVRGRRRARPGNTGSTEAGLSCWGGANDEAVLPWPGQKRSTLRMTRP